MRVVMLSSVHGGSLGLLVKGTAYDLAEAFAQDLIGRKAARLETAAAVGSGAGAPAQWAADGRTLMGPDGIARNMVPTDPSGRPLDLAGRPLARLPYADVNGASIWFPLNEAASNKVYDNTGQLIGSIQGGSTGQRWGQAPGLSFNGSNNRVVVTDGQQAGFTHSSKFICDLSTLVSRGDMIVVWFVVSHPATLPADCSCVSWGMSADPAGKGGWSVGLKATSGKPNFYLRAKGGSSVITTSIGTSGARGANSDNTRTAMAFEIAASGVSGLLEVRAYQLTLGTDGGNAQSNVGLDTPAMVPNGTSVVAADTTLPLTLGAWPTVDASTFTGYVGPNMALVNVGLQRRPVDFGVGMRICRDLRNNILAFPASAR